MSKLLKKSVKLALVQLAAGGDKSANLSKARSKVLEASSNGANIVVLPECFNSPYGTKYFPKYAETLLPSPPSKEQSPSYHALSEMAKEAKAYLIGGSIPEYWAETKKYYNTSLTFDPEGKLLATHRKVHLFDIDIPGKITFHESEVLSPGNKVTLVDLPEYGRIAVAICYDIRFPELATIAARKDAFLLLYPGAFNLTTGKLHWELQARARAMDNQVYVGLCSPARDLEADYHAWGHSMVVDPMAEVVVEADEKESIVYAELDGAKIEETRKGIPIYGQRRFDVYPDVSAGKRRQSPILATVIPNVSSPTTRPSTIVPPQQYPSPALEKNRSALSKALDSSTPAAFLSPDKVSQPIAGTRPGRHSTVVVRKRLPWLDGPHHPKQRPIPGQFESRESLAAADFAKPQPAVVPEEASGPTLDNVPLPLTSTDPALRTVGSTPSLRTRPKSGESWFKTLSLSSEPRAGVILPTSRDQAKRALGIGSESAQSANLPSSEYSTTPSSDVRQQQTAMPKDDGYSYDKPIAQPAPAQRESLEPFHVANRWLQSQMDLPLDDPSPCTVERTATAVQPKASPQANYQPGGSYRRESCRSCDPNPEPRQLPKARIPPRRSVAIPPPDSAASPTHIHPPPRRTTLFAMPSHLMGSSSSSSPPHTPPNRVTSLPARSTPLPPIGAAGSDRGDSAQPQSLNRAVNGLENLMGEALNVARDAAQSGRNEEVANILNSATLALRKASTVQGNMGYGQMSRPLRLSLAESRRNTDSDSIAPDSDASSIHTADHSVETAPTVFTMTPQPSQQPVIKSNEYLPGSQKASFEYAGGNNRAIPADQRSMTSTPPRLYQPPSADSIVRDFAYAKQKTARAVATRALSRSHGAADDYYGDTGESVATQPGVRPSVSAPIVLDKALPPLPEAHRPSVLPPQHRRRQHHPVRRVDHVPTSTVPARADSESYENVQASAPPPRRRHARRHHHHHISNFLESPDYREAPSGSRGLPNPDTEVKTGDSFVTGNRYDPALERHGSVSKASSRYSDDPPNLLERNISLRHPRRKHISLREGQGFSLGRYHRRQPIAREWHNHRKRITAMIACLNTVFVGLTAGIYAGEVPRIQYQLADLKHHVILGNVVLFACLGVTTIICWPLPLLHGRKPYTLLAFALMLPLMFPQALAVSGYRSPYNPIYRCGLLIPRAFQGIALGFANVNFLPTLFDLFGTSLMSDKPHQEIVAYDDVRRQGGGIGVWLGIWSFCFVGSMSIGFCVGALIISGLSPSWGFYIIVILLAFFLLVNVVAPETRRAPYRRSIAQYVDHEERIKRRVARGEVKLHISNEGPKWWFQEVWAGLVLTKRMVTQVGFFVLMLYLAWMYAQVTLVILLLGALLSRDYMWQPHYVGLAVLSIAFGAFLAVPLSKANLFSRARDRPQRTDSMTMRHSRVSWSSHMLRRCVFTLTLPFAALAYTLSSPGPRVSWVTPVVFCGMVGFLTNLAIAECVGLIMETFDTCDLQPGVNQKHRLQSMAETTRRRRTNYSSFPRICAGFFVAQGLGFILSAAATGVSGDVTRAYGAQTATAIVAAILLGLTVLFICVLWRWRELQVIPTNAFAAFEKPRFGNREPGPNGRVGNGDGNVAWDASMDDPEWKAVIIGNPSGKMRRMNALELSGLSRWTEIRRLNRLVRS